MADEWTRPRGTALRDIRRVITNDLMQGESKHEVVTALVTGDGWPEEEAMRLVDEVDREKDKHRSDEWVQQDIYAPDWLGFGSLVAIIPVLGWLYAFLAYRLGRRAGRSRDLWPPDGAAKRWWTIILGGLLMWIPLLNLVVSFFYSRYLYRQGARVSASDQSP